jgi:hypothetical protein
MSTYLDPFSHINGFNFGCKQIGSFQIHGPNSMAVVHSGFGCLGDSHAFAIGIQLADYSYLSRLESARDAFSLSQLDSSWDTPPSNLWRGINCAKQGDETWGEVINKRRGYQLIHRYEAIARAIRCTVTYINHSPIPQSPIYERGINPDWNSGPDAWNNWPLFEPHILHMQCDSVLYSNSSAFHSPQISYSPFRRNEYDQQDSIGMSIALGQIEPGESLSFTFRYFKEN